MRSFSKVGAKITKRKAMVDLTPSSEKVRHKMMKWLLESFEIAKSKGFWH